MNCIKAHHSNDDVCNVHNAFGQKLFAGRSLLLYAHSRVPTLTRKHVNIDDDRDDIDDNNDISYEHSINAIMTTIIITYSSMYC